jgi:hypothetical protein
MSSPRWIICERSGRWAPALRVTLLGNPGTSRRLEPILELTDLDELHRHVQRGANFLVLLEIQRRNFGDVLAWIASVGARYPAARIVALLDENLADHLEFTASAADEGRSIVDALHEAGVWDVVESPRRLGAFLAAVQTCRVLEQAPLTFGVDAQSITEWAYSLLPWQDR